MSDETIIVEVRRDRQDIYSAARLMFWRSLLWLGLIAAAGLTVVMLGPYVPMIGRAPIATVIVLSIFLMLVAAAFIIAWANGVARACASFDPTTYRFSSEGLSIESAMGTGQWPWSAYTGAMDNDRVLLLRNTTSRSTLIIPKRQIGANWARLTELLHTVLDGHAALNPKEPA